MNLSFRSAWDDLLEVLLSGWRLVSVTSNDVTRLQKQRNAPNTKESPELTRYLRTQLL